MAVAGLSRAYHAQRDALGNRWFSRGVADLNAGHFGRAVTEFRAALLYSRDNYDYQLNLAEALIGEKHTGEAYSYLVNLWDRRARKWRGKSGACADRGAARADRAGASVITMMRFMQSGLAIRR